MRKLSVLRWSWCGVVAAVTAASTGHASEYGDPAQFVNPIIGTGSSNAKDPVPGGSGGSVFPGAVVPFGMVQFSPDTPRGEPSGYGYSDHEITGFSLTHFSGAGCANNAELPILPTLGAGVISKSVGFEHKDEVAQAGYYSVQLANGVRTELTATARTGFGRFTFPDGRLNANLWLDASRVATGKVDAKIALTGKQELSGSIPSGNFCGTGNKYTVYFVAEFDHPFNLTKQTTGSALLDFGVRPREAVEVKIGLSYVSIANARANLAAEAPRWDFGQIRAEARELWNEHLGRIQVKGGSEAQNVKFYTALYHSLLHPNVFSDVNGEYIGFDDKIHREEGHVQYANYSGWDIYRNEIQLLALLFPERASDMAQSLVLDADQCGALPKWAHNNTETGVMVGDPGAAIVASAYAFGAHDFDAGRALDYMIKTGTDPEAACGKIVIRPGLKEYLNRGYLPEGTRDVGGSVSTSLEYQAADFAVSRLALALHDPRTSEAFAARAGFWRRNFDQDSGLLRPLLSNGRFIADRDFSAASTGGFVEGSSGQYTFAEILDPITLEEKLGGRTAALSKLDRFFSKLNTGIASANYYIGNEPGFASPWLYVWMGAPSRTQDVVRRILDETFTTGPEGLPGNDDLGAMSSWYVWAALGMYPALPGVGGVVLSAPTFPEAILHLPGSRTLEIHADLTPQRRYIRHAHLGLAKVRSAWLDADTLLQGGRLHFKMGDKPSGWATADLPPVFVDVKE